jgi:RDD family
MKFFFQSFLAALLLSLYGSVTAAEAPRDTVQACWIVSAHKIDVGKIINKALANQFLVQTNDSEDDENNATPTPKKHGHHHSDKDSKVIAGSSYELPKGESENQDVVLLGGKGTIEGNINGDLVLLGSEATFAGNVNGSLVVIGSKLRVEPGAHVNGDFANIASNVVDSKNISVTGEKVDLGGIGVVPVAPFFKEVISNVFLVRPMSPTSEFSWGLAVLGLALCLFLGWLFPQTFVETDTILQKRPAPAFLTGLAVILGGAVLSALLVITVIGIIALPFLGIAWFILDLFGKTAVSYTIGKRIFPNAASHGHATLAWILAGTIVRLILYCIPVVGFIAWGIVLLIGAGSFAIYLVERYRPATNGRPLPPPAGEAAATPPVTHSTQLALGSVEPVVALTLPKAQFLPRLGANLIDLVVLYSVLSSLHLTRVTLLVWVIYRFGMYVWKSATLGQLVLNLRIQKSNGTTLVGDYSTSAIRALSSLISLIPLGLGFIWILFSKDLDAWHDKISNTHVVQSHPAVAHPLSGQAPATQPPSSPPSAPQPPEPPPHSDSGEPRS